MLLVKTHIKNSIVNGIGLFASEFIPKGTIIWELNKKLDLIITQKEYEKLPILVNKHFDHFAYYCEKEGGWVLCFDNARFVNHSDNPNTEGLENTVAKKDIQIDEEITENYYVFNEKEPKDNY